MVKRLVGALFAALLMFGNVRGLLGPCAQHDPVAGRTAAQAHSGPSHDHHQHAPQKGKSCTCLDHCTSCPTAGLGGVAPGVQTAVATVIETGNAAVVAQGPTSNVQHRLPFATAPPRVS